MGSTQHKNLDQIIGGNSRKKKKSLFVRIQEIEVIAQKAGRVAQVFVFIQGF